MKPTIASASTIVLEKDDNNFIHVKLYEGGNEGINITTITKYPELANLDQISRTVLFLRKKYGEMLLKAGIISHFFETKEGYWCGFIHIDVFFELDNSPNRQYTVKVS